MMDSSPPPSELTATRLPIQRDYLKKLPGDGRLVNLMIQVSNEPGLDASFAAEGWDVLAAGPFSVRLKLEA